MARNIYTTLSNRRSGRKKIFIRLPRWNTLVLASCFLLLLASLNLDAQTFVHPGGLHTKADLDRMKVTSQNLPVQTLAAGVYYVQVINGIDITTQKIIKQ